MKITKFARFSSSEKNMRPVIAVNYDGVIADTNKIKAKWIKDNLNKEILPNLCNRTDCTKIITNSEYEQMSDYVYGEEASSMANPTPDIKDVISELSKSFRFIIITSRSFQNLKYAIKWLSDNGIQDYFEEILSVGQNQTKLEVAEKKKAVMLIDDDIRHFDNWEKYNVTPVLFSNIKKEVKHVQLSSWIDALS